MVYYYKEISNFKAQISFLFTLNIVTNILHKIFHFVSRQKEYIVLKNESK